jgi:outer membrane protein assembly factor BamB
VVIIKRSLVPLFVSTALLAAGAALASVQTYPFQAWVTRYVHPTLHTRIAATAVDADGDVYVVGTATASRSPMITAKYSGATGEVLWQVWHDDSNRGKVPAAIAVDGSGGVVVTGSSRGAVNTFLTIKYRADTGEQLWVARRPGNSLNALALDAAGDVHVTGFTAYPPSTAEDLTTVKYDGSTGAEIWVSQYRGAQDGHNRGTAIAVGCGAVYVTGDSWGGFTNQNDFATLKYDAATGRQLWAARHNGPGNRHDMPRAIAADEGNGVYVFGLHWSGTPAYLSFCTVRYDAATGRQDWMRQTDGVWGTAYPRDMAVDARGGVFATGYDHHGMLTVRMDAATGTPTWLSRYQGSFWSGDTANAITVDDADNVYITGRSWAISDGLALATLSYSAASGELRWVRRLPSSSDTDAADIATDGRGGVVAVGRAHALSPTAWIGSFVTVRYQDTPHPGFRVLSDLSRPLVRGAGTPVRVELTDAQDQNISSPGIQIQPLALLRKENCGGFRRVEPTGIAGARFTYHGNPGGGGFYQVALRPQLEPGEYRLRLQGTHHPKAYHLDFSVR